MRPSEVIRREHHARMSKRSLVILCLVNLLPWLVVVFLVMRGREPAASVPSKAEPKAETRAHAPFGEFVSHAIHIEPPEEFVSPNYFSALKTVWHFPGMNEEQVRAKLKELGLTDAEQQAVAAGLKPATAQGVTVEPPVETVFLLSPASRGKLYEFLARTGENALQADPFIQPRGRLVEWLEQAGVAPAVVADVKRLLYARGEMDVLADHPVMLARIPAPEERRRVLKTLLRASPLLVRIRITPKTNVHDVVDYFGKAGRAKDIRPLVESLARVEDGVTLDLAHLMPPFARKRLYTYPEPSNAPEAARRDCYWTALNFFEDPPDDRYTDAAVVKKTLETDYYPVMGTPMFGDIVLMNVPGRGTVHACVYIANDIVFTKNGPSHTSAWLLANLESVKATFGAEDLQVTFWRWKHL
jgi:hypothetical protein